MTGVADAPSARDWIAGVPASDDRVGIVSADGVVLTRAELVARVGGLAAELARRGVRPGDRVALQLDRSPELIVGMLAALVLGAPYVVVDPRYPAARRAFILEDCDPAILLGDGGLAAAAWPATGPIPGHAPPAERLAYLAYTSGTTGVPKGVAVSHGALTAYLRWCLDALPATGDGVPLFASAAFDHAVTCIYPPLIRGEPLKLLPEVGSGRALGDELLARGPYSFVKATPSHLRFLDAEQRALLGAMSGLVMVGGEAVDVATVAALRARDQTLRVINHYGPTEATVGCLCFEIPSDWERDPVPIGMPLPHVDAEVRDGELVVGGACLAAGYWRDGRVVDEGGFVADDDGCRWYRTGDQVVRDAAHGLVFAGRGDRQVKRLGHRLDLSEVEAALLSAPTVEAAIAVQPARGGALSALVTPEHGLDETALRAAVAELLVAAAVPARIVRVAALPVTAHGKLDPAAALLLLEDEPSPGAADDAVARLAALWRDALAVDAVGEDDDFFDLGGDSLAAVEVIEGVSEQLGVEVELGLLFTHPTFAAFARAVAGLGGPGSR